MRNFILVCIVAILSFALPTLADESSAVNISNVNIVTSDISLVPVDQVINVAMPLPDYGGDVESSTIITSVANRSYDNADEQIVNFAVVQNQNFQRISYNL